MYLEFTVATDMTWFLRGHLHAFAYFGGIPRQVVHDNLKTAVLDRGAEGTIHWHPQYLDFASYYGFRPHACPPYRAQTKGKVERSIGYVRGNFWPGLQAEDLGDLNAQARLWLDTVANVRVHGTTRVVPFTRLAQEGLLPLSVKPPYDTSLLVPRQSSRDCLVSYAGNLYSVPAAYALQRVLLKVTEDDELIVLAASGAEVARHRVASGRHQRIVQADHYQGLAPARAGLSSVPSRVLAAPSLHPPRPTPTGDFAALLGAPTVERRALAVYEQCVEPCLMDGQRDDGRREGAP